MRFSALYPIEDRVANSITGTVKVRTDEDEDKEQRFQIVDNMMRGSVHEQLDRDERGCTLRRFFNK